MMSNFQSYDVQYQKRMLQGQVLQNRYCTFQLPHSYGVLIILLGSQVATSACATKRHGQKRRAAITKTPTLIHSSTWSNIIIRERISLAVRIDTMQYPRVMICRCILIIACNSLAIRLCTIIQQCGAVESS